MARIDRAKEFGKEPLNIIDLKLDTCSLTFGVSPCTATGEKCYNTRSTCKDVANYTKASKKYTFADKKANLPVTLGAIPAIKSITFSPTRLEFGKGLGYRSKCSITLSDFKHDDTGVDPYKADRAYDTSQGTYFGKLLARNPYYNGRQVDIKTGYNGKTDHSTSLFPAVDLFPTDALLPESVSSEPYPSDYLYPSSYLFPSSESDAFTENDFDTRMFIIEGVVVNQNDTVTITGKDILKKLDGERTQVPMQSSAVLLADILAADTVLTLTDAEYSKYPDSGYVRINDEIIQYTGKIFPHTLYPLIRGQYGTTAADHSLDDIVQLCAVYTAENVVDIIYDILVTYGGIDPAYIPYDNGATGINQEWDDEKADYLTYANFSTVISEPEGADVLLEEITEQAMLMLWWDDVTQKIRLKALTPPTQRAKVGTLMDGENFIADSIKHTYQNEKRYSQMWVRYAPKDWTKLDENSNYKTVYVGVDLEQEGADLYGDARVKAINSRWIALDIQASTLYSRFSALYNEAPVQITAKLDAKDSDLKIGDYVDISTRKVLNTDGSNKVARYFITEMRETNIGHEVQFTAMSTGFILGLRYAFYAADTAPADYADATDEEKFDSAYYCDASGLMPDGDEGYCYI